MGDSPYADITFTQTNESGVSFDLVARCYFSYRQNDAEECVARGLKCHEGSYTIMLAGDEEGTTEESVNDFRMHCRDPTQLEDDQTFPSTGTTLIRATKEWKLTKRAACLPRLCAANYN